MIVGFTGTRLGMTDAQRSAVRTELAFGENRHGPLTFVHGDCTGADEEAHQIAMSLGLRVEIRPCDFKSLRAYCQGAAMVHPVDRPLPRNCTIVDVCHLLIAAPPIAAWPTLERGGTIYTIRYARKQGRRVAVCLPTGQVEYA